MSIHWESEERDLNSFLIDTMLHKSQLELLSAINILCFEESSK